MRLQNVKTASHMSTKLVTMMPSSSELLPCTTTIKGPPPVLFLPSIRTKFATAWQKSSETPTKFENSTVCLTPWKNQHSRHKTVKTLCRQMERSLLQHQTLHTTNIPPARTFFNKGRGAGRKSIQRKHCWQPNNGCNHAKPRSQPRIQDLTRIRNYHHTFSHLHQMQRSRVRN